MPPVCTNSVVSDRCVAGGVEIISRRCGVVVRCCGGANKMFRHGKELWRVLNSCWQRQIKKRGWLLVLQSDLDEKMCRQLR